MSISQPFCFVFTSLDRETDSRECLQEHLEFSGAKHMMSGCIVCKLYVCGKKQRKKILDDKFRKILFTPYIRQIKYVPTYILIKYVPTYTLIKYVPTYTMISMYQHIL